MIEKDEFDEGERKIFNYGHTFGHAIEAVSKYEVSHGNAVTLGMDIANYISLKKGFIDHSIYEYLLSMIRKNIPDYRLTEDRLQDYFTFLSKDKKNIDNSLVCILPYGVGDMRTTIIDDIDSVKDIIREYFKR
jgi:3-dehydroquinate synthase